MLEFRKKRERGLMPDLSPLGIIGVRVWLGCIPYSQQVLGNGGFDLIFSNFFRGLFPVLVVFFLFGRELSKRALGAMNVSCTVVLVTLGELLWFSDGPLLFMAMTAASMAAGWLYIQWGEVYARMPLRRALAYACSSLAITGVIVIALSFTPDEVTGIALVAIPSVGCLMYSDSLELCYAEDAEICPLREPRVSWSADAKWVISVFVYAVMWGIVQAMPFGFVANRDSVYHVVYRVGGAVLALVPVVFMYVFKRDFNLLFIWYWMTGASIVSFLMILLAGDSLSGVALTLFAVGNYSVLAYWWMRCVDFSQRCLRPAYMVFALGWLVLLLGVSLGEVITKWLVSQGASSVLLVSLGVFLVVTYLTVLLHPDKSTSWIAGKATDFDENAQTVDLTKRRVECAADCFQLTKREREVVEILAHGHTLQYASNQMNISLNTARGHIKRVYAKMDIHSKEEMVTILQSYDKEGANVD